MSMEPAHEAKLQIFKTVHGDITFLRFVGIIDESFDGPAIAKGLSAQLVISMAEIRRITSFGIRQWMECVSRASEACEAIYFVDCSPRILDQFNMVGHFGGRGTIVSFYAPFRCETCGNERQRLIQVDRDQELLREMRIEDGKCPRDGGREYFDDDPSTFFAYVASQPPFELDPRVAAFLASRTQYAVPDALRKTKIEKKVRDRCTFITIGGDIGEELPIGKMAEGLEGDVVLDVTSVGRITERGLLQWRRLLRTIAPSTERILVLGLPPSMLEHLSRVEDLAEKAQVLSVYLPFMCKTCAVTSHFEVDVAASYDSLRVATPPELRCPDCKGPVTCVASEAMLAQLPELPQPAADLDFRQLSKWSREPSQTPANVLTSGPHKTAAPTSSARPLLLGLVLLSLAAAAIAIYVSLRQESAQRSKKPVLIEASHPTAPRWRDQSFTVEGENVLLVGSSGLVPDKEEGFKIARAAAVDELWHQVGVSIRDPLWVEHVGAQFQSFRAKALSELEKALVSGDPESIQRCRRHVFEGRERVARSMTDGAGALLHPEQAQFYWEKLRVGQQTRYQVSSLFRVGKNEFRRLVEHYSQRDEALSAAAVPYFPEMAWRYDLTQGAVIVGMRPDSALRHLGVLPGDIFLSAQDRAIKDGRSFARVLAEEHADLERTGGTMVLRIRRGDAPIVEHRLRVAKKVRQPPMSKKGQAIVDVKGGKKLPPATIWDDDPFQ